MKSKFSHDGFHDNGPHRTIYMNNWSSDGRTVWERLRDVILFKDVCCQEQALTFQKTPMIPSELFSLSLNCIMIVA